MGTWSVPWKSLASARAFQRRMSARWPVQVSLIEEDGEEVVDWEVEQLYELCGNDGLFDEIGLEASARRRSFDVRPLVKRCYREWFREESAFEPRELPRMNLVRKALGLRPLGEPKAAKKKRVRKRKSVR